MSPNALSSDLRFALRVLRRNPTYTAAAVLTLALGAGAATAVFSVVDATLLRPLPFATPDRIIALNSVAPGPDGADLQYAVSEIELVRWRSAAGTLAGVEGLQPRSLAVTGAGEPETIRGAAVTSGLLPLLGVPAERGRTFTADEERTDSPLAVISHALWRRKFNLDPRVIGASITVDGRTREIVGVMPPGYRPLLDPSDIWIPLNPKIDSARSNARMTAGVARLQPGATIEQAEGELRPISAAIAREFPVGHGHARPQAVPLRAQLLGDRRPALLGLTAAALLLLVLACANVLNLTLGHIATRRGELVLRVVIGAGPLDLVRQHLVQSLVVAAAGTASALLLVIWALPPLVALYTRNGQPTVDITIDWRVLLFASAVTIGTAVATGTVPIVQARRAGVDGGAAQAANTRFGSGRWERRVRRFLVGLQVAFAILLLCGAGTFLHSLRRLMQTSPGFQSDGVLTMQLALPPGRYPDIAARARFVAAMLERVGALPGITAAGTTQTTFMPNESMETLLWTDGRPLDLAQADSAHIRHVTAGYFRTLQVPIVDGRAIDDRDRLGTPPVCMVSAAFARRFWPHASAVGHRVRRTSATAQWMTIVGVAGDVMDAGVGVLTGPTLYVPYLQANTATARVTLVARTTGDPLASAAAVRQAIWSVDSSQPVSDVGRLGDRLVESIGDQRFRTVLLAVFAALGLAIATVGVYGVTAASVASRTREAGIRLALGARPRRLVSELVSETMAGVASGAAAGLATYVVVGRFLVRLLYLTPPADPRIMALAAALICGAAMGAAYLRARVLGALSPLTAIRHE